MVSLAEQLHALGFKSSTEHRKARDKAVSNLARGGRTASGRFTSKGGDLAVAQTASKALRRGAK